MIKSKLVKRAWIRDESVPAGIKAKGRFPCPCNNAPMINFTEGGPDIFCNCGRRYAWDGAIKGRSIGSDTLTAYRVIFEDGTEYITSMSAETTLGHAWRYFVGRTIDGKIVDDVEPVEILN